MDHVHMGKSSRESSWLCSKDLPSTSSVKEHPKGHRNRKAQMKDSEQPITRQSNVEVGHQKVKVQGKPQCTVSSVVPTAMQVGVKKLNTDSRADVQRQVEVSDALFQVQRETCAGQRGRKQQYERTEYKNIWSLGNSLLWCELCDVTLLNSDSVEQHIVGKQHTENLAIAAVNIEPLWKTVRELEGGQTNNICMLSHNKFWCGLCSKSMDTNGVVSHVGASSHQQKLKKLDKTKKKYTNTSQKWVQHDMYDIWEEICRAENGRWSNIWHTSGDTFHCEPCKVLLSVHDVLAHVMDTPHQEKIRAPENIEMNEKLAKISDYLWQEIHKLDRAHQAYFKIDNSTTLYCTSCCVRIPATVQNVTDHIRGKTHMTTIVRRLTSEHPSHMKQANSLVEENFPSPIVTQTENLAENRPRVKDESFTSEGSQSEICKASNNAQEALVKALVPREKDGSDHSGSLLQGKSCLFHCTLCDTETELEETWNLHKCSKKHRTQVSKLMAEGKNPVTCTCSNCGVTIFCSQSDFAKHICHEVPSNILNGIYENAQQLSKSNAAESLLQENLKCGEQADPTDDVPRIVVSGYPKRVGMDLLYNFFSDFGTVCFVAVGSESAVIEFVERDAVKRTQEKPLFLANAALTVKTLTYYNHQGTVHSARSVDSKGGSSQVAEVVHENVVSAHASRQSLQETLDALCNTTSYVSNQKKDKQVCQFLETLFSAVFPGCKAISFGSRLSGLALSDSDLDIFLDTGGMYNGRSRQGSDIQELIVSAAESTLLADPECCNVEGVPSARTPIIKFFHTPSGTQCDVAFRHGLGCENTKLIKFYLSLDPRVRPVILFIKHWAHSHKLTGQSNITSYALTWLVIFYLQEASGFGLPSVELLQRLHEGPVKRIAGMLLLQFYKVHVSSGCECEFRHSLALDK
ncbi:hypothetical protein B7P43_G03142 [Cryptotermes secundus]|uniref:U1-type domain-containing protein n=1 Tax=Cryptotermes secundus TaxID=105785 RepID=A0A2J7QNE5_9NEOP|nr:uncharacterized protein LOC111866405 isoform X2 [Cryptotermes secundus]PNF30107.1 hypothetical protein B7P43_G03142 [Cryptotermes secundus]PNF30111.1 hypothetical protein B7P43_G03142 [Cryptotermes secundus]